MTTPRDDAPLRGPLDVPPDGDPLDALASLWSSLAPPARTDDLEREDELTRASVAWMRTAWEALELPAASDAETTTRAAGDVLTLHAHPQRPAVDTRTAPVRSMSWRPLAAAAVLLLSLAGPLLLLSPAGPTTDGSAFDPRVTTHHDGGEPAPQHGPIVTRADAHRLELRSGPVRLVLLTNTTAPSP